MSGTETCETCTLLRPVAERRLSDLVQEAVHVIRKLPGAGFSGDDSGLNDVFEEWADQLAFEHSIIFETYDDLVHEACVGLVGKLGDAEIALLAAFSDEFDDYVCTQELISKQLYQALATFAVNYAETRRLDADDDIPE